MIVVNMHEAKTRLSELVRRTLAGERVVLARNGVPVVDLVPHDRPERREGGQLRGRFWISEDFDAPMPELEKLIYGE
jgi:prevent-host-death family protein